MDTQHEASGIAPDVPDEWEQELRAAINSEPSAFFVTRVRAVVATESMARRWWIAPALGARFAGAMLLVAVATTAWLLWVRTATDSVAVATAPLVTRERAPLVPGPATTVIDRNAQVVPPVSPTTHDGTTPVTSPNRTTGNIPARPQPSVPSNATSLSLAWLDAVDRGLMTVVIVPTADSPRAEASLSTALAVPPLVIAPLTVEPLPPFAD